MRILAIALNQDTLEYELEEVKNNKLITYIASEKFHDVLRYGKDLIEKEGEKGDYILGTTGTIYTYTGKNWAMATPSK